MKKIQKFRIVLQKYFKGTLSKEEEKMLNTFQEEMQQNGLREDEVKNDLLLRYRIKSKIEKVISSEEGKIDNSRWWKTAAVAAILILGGFLYLTPDHSLFGSNSLEYITKKGEHKTIWLSDSTKVVLNSKTVLRYPEKFSGTKREVELIGEAYFIVHRDPSRPFIVHSNNINIEVLGTSFNIKNYDGEESKVVVVSGKVKVSDTLSNTLVLTKNEIAISDKNKLLQQWGEANDHILWLKNKINFQNASLEEFTAVLNRSFQEEIVLDKSLKNFNKRISGSYSSDNLTDILSGIDFIYDIHFKKSHDTIVLFK